MIALELKDIGARIRDFEEMGVLCAAANNA